MRLDNTTAPVGSRATTCERLRCRSTPTYTMTGPPSCRLPEADATSRPKHGSGGPLLHGIKRLIDAAGRRLPEVCRLDLYALRRGGTCRCGWSASVSPTTPLRVLTIM